MNNVVLMGRLTREPEVRDTVAGKKVARFTLAVDNGNNNTAFVPIVVWEDLAIFAENYCKKGARFCVSGYITTSSYKDRDGNTRSSWEVNANRVEFAESKEK